MTAHVAFARKYRPRCFDEVVGQEAIAQALKGAVKAGRTAPVYLFSGSHGVGKTSMARILAKSLGCPNARDGEPCLTCSTCVSIDRGEALDVLEIDAASNRSVDDAERIRQNVHYRPQAAALKVYILDEVHQLTRHAFDALLKTFEEAPEHVRFVLATTELHKVPTTIRSRAQVFHFRRHGRAEVERRLSQIVEQEGVRVSPGALGVISRRARGSMRDAQKMLDQVLTLGLEPGGELTAEEAARLLGAFTADRVERLLTGIAEGDPRALLEEVGAHLAGGGQVASFLEELMDALRGVLYLQTCGESSPLVDELAMELAPLRTVAGVASEEGLLYGLQLLAEVEQKLRQAKEPRVLLEVALVRLARLRELRPLGEVLARLERLEQALQGGGGGGEGPPSSPGRAVSSPAPTRPRSGPAAQGGPAPQGGASHRGAAARGASPRSDAPPRGDASRSQAPRTAASQTPAVTAGSGAGAGSARRTPAHDARQSEPTGGAGPRARTYSYPASMRAGGEGTGSAAAASARPDFGQSSAAAAEFASATAVALAEPPRAAAPAQAAGSSAMPTERELAELDRDSRHDGQPGFVHAGLNAGALASCWKKLSGELHEQLGMAAELITLSDPRVRLEPGNTVVLQVSMKDMFWSQLNTPHTTQRLGELFSQALDAAVTVRLQRTAGAPVSFAKAANPGKASPQGGAGGGGASSVYGEAIVKFAQRELDARQMSS